MLTFDLLALLGSAGVVGLVLSIRVICRWRRPQARLVGKVLEAPSRRSREGEEMLVEVEGRPRRVLLGGAPVELGRRPAQISVGDRLIVIGEKGQRLCDERLYREARTESLLEAHRVERASPLKTRPLLASAVLACSLAALVLCAAHPERQPGIVGDTLLERARRILCGSGTRAEGWAHLYPLEMDLAATVGCELPGGYPHGLTLRAWGDERQLVEHRYGKQHGLRLVVDGAQPTRLEHFSDGLETGVSTTWWSNGRVQSREEYLRGERHGLVERFHSDGSPELLLSFRHGQAEGEHVEWKDGEEVHHGQLRRGEREGLWSLRHDCPCPELTEQVRRCEVTYRSGQLEGPAQWVFEDGREMSGSYRQGRATGRFRVTDGKLLLREGSYRENVRDGHWTWYAGHASSKGALLRREGHYRLGQLHGRWVEKVTTPDGTVSERVVFYLRDVKVSRQTFEEKEPAALAAY